MYQIDNAGGRKHAPKMSAFPKHMRTFQEPISATQDMTIGPGKTLPDLIRRFYPGAVPHGFSASFGFLDRDNKSRAYLPGETDQYVFKNSQSISDFSKSAYELIEVLNQLWVGLGLKLKRDEDRQCSFPDSEGVIEQLANNSNLRSKVNDIYFILANADIMKKACIVRSINAGWWAVSYAGKTAPNRAYFSKSLRAHKRAVATIMASAVGKAKFEALWSEGADPLYTNPGYPFFTAQVDAQGNPVTRINTVQLFKGIVSTQPAQWADVLKSADERAGKFGMAGFPFCIAPLRRLQPGYKFAHQFQQTPSGLVSAYDERGVNSQRVAHMVPYVYNLLTAPVSTMYKTVRYFLPGAYHDGDAKRARLQQLRVQGDKGQLWLAEADYSNFDRFMPVDLIEEIVSWFTSATDRPTYWHDALMFLHKDASLVWPDYTSEGRGFGWLFKPGALGLLSGVKATSETGTLVNSVVNGEALARTYGWTEDQLYSYLVQYLDSPIGSKEEYFYVQSDDTQLIARRPDVLAKHSKFFMEAVAAAGLKGSVELADRFLMRHMQDGVDRPVPARVWQNTLSNESPPESEIIFLAGLAARTDGLFGLKSVDPFITGVTQTISASELTFTKAVVANLRKFVSSARHSSKTGLSLLDLLLEAGQAASPANGGYRVKSGASLVKLTSLRKAINATLAKQQQEEYARLSDKAALSGTVARWIYDLYRDRHVPSSLYVLDELLESNPGLEKSLKHIAAKEEAFFRFAISELGVKHNIFK